MKKLFTLLFAIIASAITAMAADYTDNLIITVDNGKPTTINDVKITVTQQENGKYSFSLKNFSFAGNKVGDIELNDIEGQEKDGIITLNVSETTITVKNPSFVLGNLINKAGGIKFSMTAKISNATNKMYADMTMKAMGQDIKAIYGDKKNITTGITNLPVNNDNEKVELYNLSGQRITEAKPGQVVIEKRGGKAVKVVK